MMGDVILSDIKIELMRYFNDLWRSIKRRNVHSRRVGDWLKLQQIEEKMDMNQSMKIQGTRNELDDQHVQYKVGAGYVYLHEIVRKMGIWFDSM